MKNKTYSAPQWWAIFLQNGSEIQYNGVRLAPVEALRESFPNAAIITKDNVPENWQNMSVVECQLVAATVDEVATRREKLVKELQAKIRSERDKKIKELMWIQQRHIGQVAGGIATTLTEAQYTEYEAYLQALRNITKQATFAVGEVEWPKQPEYLS